MGAPKCTSCAYLYGEDVLPAAERRLLDSLCSAKVGQISAANRGVYAEGEYPS